MVKAKSKNIPIKKQSQKVTLPDWPWNERQTFLLYMVISAIITLVLFSKYLFGPNLFLFDDVGSDTLTVFYPNLVQSARYFQEVGWPGWSFYIGMGSNFYPGYIINPFQWLFLPMGPESIAYTIAWMQAAVLFVTGLVFYQFLREAQFSLPVVLIGALVYGFGGYLVLGNTWYGHAYVVFWMTLTFLGFELLLRKKIWWLFPIPFLFVLGARGYFLVLFMALYGLVRMLDVYGGAWKEILMGYKRMVICGVLALLFAFPFIGGQWHKYANSPRVTGNVSYSEKLSDQPVFGLSVARHNVTAIMRTFSNDMLGAGSDYKGWRNYLEAPAFYIGLITLFFVFQFFALASRRQKWIYGSFLFFWLFLIMFPWFRYAFYGFAGNYYKGALSLFIPFSFLFVGLLGFQEIISGKALNKWVLFSSALILLCVLWYPYNLKDVAISTDMQLKVSVFLIGYTAILWIYSEGMVKKVLFPALISLVSIEALLFAWPTVNDRTSIAKSAIAGKQYHFDDSMEAVRKIKESDKDLFYRIDKVYGSVKKGYNDGMVQGFFGSKSYQSHNHKYYVEFLHKAGVIDGTKEANTRWLVGVSASNILHGLFSIKYLMSDEETREKVDAAIYTPVDTTGKTITSRNNYYIPFGIPFEKVYTESAFDQLPANQKKRIFYFCVVADDQAPWKNALQPLVAEETSFFGTATRDRTKELATKTMAIDYFSQNHIKGHIVLDTTAMMFFSIPYDQGWKATVNGKAKPLEKVNFGFTGLLLEPGKHAIQLTYEPPLSKWGWLGMIAAAIGAFILTRLKKYF